MKLGMAAPHSALIRCAALDEQASLLLRVQEQGVPKAFLQSLTTGASMAFPRRESLRGEELETI